MAEQFDVVVAGLGAFGACACEVLARRGARVLGLDRHGIPHALGSSHGAARAIRLCYYEHPDYVPLLQLAYRAWADLARRSGVEVLLETGGLYIGRADGDLVPGSRLAAERFGLPHEMLDRDETAARYPQFDIPRDLVAMHEPRAGVLFPERLIAAAAGLAAQDGAVLAGMDPLTSWSVSGDGVEITTARRRCRASRLVLCAGPWARRLLPDLDLPLTVTRQVQGWIWPRRPERFTPDRFPIWCFEEPGEPFNYGFPLLPDRPGVKVARHEPGQPADPDRIDRAIGRGDLETIRAAAARLPDASGPILTASTCMYTNTPDGHFVVDVHPGTDRVVIACGFSGHGLKFASGMGEILADLALEGGTEHPIEFLRLGRFEGAPPVPPS